MSTTRGGAVARYTFTGKGIAVVMPRSPSRAWVEVRIDGAYVGKYSLWASSLEGTPDRLLARLVDERDPDRSSSARSPAASRKLVSLDAFVVTR